ncbi:MAG: PfkB family carbohydrate kinase [Planctomycetota bacterium]|nr:PfkB family carbohydrate kinase [Planctomycetota bacterium]
MLARSRLESLLSNFPNLTIGLVGDLFLDRYLDIEPGVEEISIETDLEAYQIDLVRNSPGALGTVMNNLAALGVGRLVPITVIGDDGQAYDLLKELRRLPVDDSYMIQDEHRLTPTYTKPLKQDAGGHWRELNRLDLRTRAPLSVATSKKLYRNLSEALAKCDGLIVLDQINETNWGVVNDQTRQVLDGLTAADPEKLVFVDSRNHLGWFQSGVLKGNRAELLGAIETPDDESLTVEQAAQQLSRRTGRAVYATLGEAGILIARPDGTLSRSPAHPVSGPIDIVGAGDSATSGIVASLLSGASDLEAADIANLVAGITIQQLGTTGTATPQQVFDRHAELTSH